MEYRRLGQAGLKVSALALGGWTTYGGSVKDADVVGGIVRAAYEAGVNFFDIADVYARGESERMMGAALKDLPRHRLVISSKVFWPMSEDVNDRGLSRKHIMESVERSLRRIGTDYLDLYFCHRWDSEVGLEETARAMDDLVHQGKVLYWGTSEWTGKQMREAHRIAEARGLYAPAVEQPVLNLVQRGRFERDVAPAARDLGMGLVTWSPLASGLLTGKYDDGVPKGSRLSAIDWLRERLVRDDLIDRVKRLKDVADDAGTSRSKLALAWALSRPGVSSVITGATQKAQLEENLAALSLELAPDLAACIDRIFEPGNQLGE